MNPFKDNHKSPTQPNITFGALDEKRLTRLLNGAMLYFPKKYIQKYPNELQRTGTYAGKAFLFRQKKDAIDKRTALIYLEDNDYYKISGDPNNTKATCYHMKYVNYDKIVKKCAFIFNKKNTSQFKQLNNYVLDKSYIVSISEEQNMFHRIAAWMDNNEIRGFGEIISGRKKEKKITFFYKSAKSYELGEKPYMITSSGIPNFDEQDQLFNTSENRVYLYTTSDIEHINFPKPTEIYSIPDEIIEIYEKSFYSYWITNVQKYLNTEIYCESYKVRNCVTDEIFKQIFFIISRI